MNESDVIVVACGIPGTVLVSVQSPYIRTPEKPLFGSKVGFRDRQPMAGQTSEMQGQWV